MCNRKKTVWRGLSSLNRLSCGDDFKSERAAKLAGEKALGGRLGRLAASGAGGKLTPERQNGP
jgi:hypothetical protein